MCLRTPSFHESIFYREYSVFQKKDGSSFLPFLMCVFPVVVFFLSAGRITMLSSLRRLVIAYISRWSVLVVWLHIGPCWLPTLTVIFSYLQVDFVATIIALCGISLGVSTKLKPKASASCSLLVINLHFWLRSGGPVVGVDWSCSNLRFCFSFVFKALFFYRIKHQSMTFNTCDSSVEVWRDSE